MLGEVKTYRLIKVSHKFLNFLGKAMWGNHGKPVKSKWERRYQIAMRYYTQKTGYSKCVHVGTRGDVGRIKKSVIKSARTKWMAPNKCHEIFSVH